MDKFKPGQKAVWVSKGYPCDVVISNGTILTIECRYMDGSPREYYFVAEIPGYYFLAECLHPIMESKPPCLIFTKMREEKPEILQPN